MPRPLLLNHVLLLLCCSIYLGTGFSLVFFSLPIVSKLMIDNHYLTIVMLVCATIMLATEWFSGLRWVPVLVLLSVIAAIVLNAMFGEWVHLNRVQIALWAVQWSAMAYWFYRMALEARRDR